MTLHWRQALTSALVGSMAAILVTVAIHGTPSRDRLALALAIGLAVAASRLIEPRR